MRWHRFCLLVAVFLLACFSAWAENPVESMSEAEILTELSESLEARENLLNARESILTQRANQLEARETLLIQRENALTAIESLSTSLREELKREDRHAYWRGFAHGSVVGLAAGTAGGGWLGFKIGIAY